MTSKIENYYDKYVRVTLSMCDSKGKNYKTMGVDVDKDAAFLKALVDAFKVKNYYDSKVAVLI